MQKIEGKAVKVILFKNQIKRLDYIAEQRGDTRSSLVREMVDILSIEWEKELREGGK